MKKYFFLLTLASVLAACDGGSPADELTSQGDAGRGPDALAAGDSGRGAGAEVRGAGCAVPEPRVKSMWGTAVSSTPRGGFRVLADPVVCSTSYNPPPRDCSRPVDGFSDGTTWCCVSTARGKDGLFHMSRATAQCFDNTMLLPASTLKAPGNVALCSPEGKFVGWDCMDGS